MYEVAVFPIGYCIKLVLLKLNNIPSEELKDGFVASTDIEVNMVQLWNARSPILVTELGIMIVTKLVQFRIASLPILVNPMLGKDTDFRPVQPLNALLLKLVIPLYKTAFISVVLFWNVVGITAINPL